MNHKNGNVVAIIKSNIHLPACCLREILRMYLHKIFTFTIGKKTVLIGELQKKKAKNLRYCTKS